MARPDAENTNQEFPNRHACGNLSAVKTVRGLRLRHAASASIRKDRCEQDARHDTDQRRDCEQAEMRWRHAEEEMAGAVDGGRKEHGGESRENADHNRQRQEELILAKAKLLDARLEENRH